MEDKCGFEIGRFVNQVDISFICSICLGVLRNPIVLTCDHSFCKGCIEKWELSKAECPQCKVSFTSREKSAFGRTLLTMLNKLELRCENAGCNAIFALGEVEGHEKQCQFKMVPCTHSSCRSVIFTKDLEVHAMKHNMEAMERRLRTIETEYENLKLKMVTNDLQQDIASLPTDENENFCGSSEKRQKTNALTVPFPLSASPSFEGKSDASLQNDFYQAVVQNRPLLVSRLLQTGRIKIDAKNEDWSMKSTALISAARFGNVQTCSVLISQGANVNLTNVEGNTALMMAAWSGNENICSMLLDSGADVNAVNHEDETALMFAAKFGHPDVCSYLLSRGAQLYKKNKKGLTAFLLARDSEVLNILTG